MIDLALTTLIMFMPHITTTLVNDLPQLFVIYARILCWDQYAKDDVGGATRSQTSDSEYGSDFEPKQALHFDPSWDVVETTMDGSQSLKPKADYLFTFLYGLFPLNFMNFIRKPRRYLKMKSYPNAEDLDMNQTSIRTRSEVYQRQHKLHPNFYMTTAEDELVDNKWLKSDPADLVSECLGLCIFIAATLNDPGPPPTSKLPALPLKARSVMSGRPVHSGDDERYSIQTQDLRPLSNRTTLSTTLTGTTAHFSDPTKSIPRRPSQLSLTETARSPRDSSPLPRMLGGDGNSPMETRPPTPRFEHKLQSSAPPSPPRSVINAGTLPKVPSLQSFAQTLSRFPIPQAASPGSDIYNAAMLQREVMLLKNDLNFERYQKQKYIEQIGNLQRRQMSDSTVETDTQTLINKNRGLKSRLLKSDERYEQLKKEIGVSRTQAKRFEEQLTARLKTYRDDEKTWQSKFQSLKHSLEMSKVECEDLKSIVLDSERRERESRNQLGTLSIDLEEVGNLKNNVVDLESKLCEYEQRDLEYQRAREEHASLLANLQSAQMKLTALDQEREQMRQQFEQKLLTLEANARNSQIVGSAHTGTLPGSVQQMIDSALAIQQSKFAQLKRNYTQLQHKLQETEMRNQELESSIGNGRSSVLSLTRFADDSPLNGIDRQNSFGSRSVGSMTKSHNIRRQDFALSGSSNEPMGFDDLPVGRPNTQGAIITRTSSGGIAANATNPLLPISPTYKDKKSLRDGREATTRLDQSLAHDFASTTSPLDNLADATHMGSSSAAPKIAETRSYGRGGAGNVKKPKEHKEKDSAAKKSGFRLKNIM